MLLSLDLGQNKIMASVLNKNQFLSPFILPAPTVEKGKIGDIVATADLLRKELKARRLRPSKCAFSLPTSSALIRELRLPTVPRQDMLKLIRTELSNMVSVTDDAVVDYITVEEIENTTSVIAVLIKKSLIEQCVTLGKMLSLRCVRVELHLSSMMKYLNQVLPKRDNVNLVAGVYSSAIELNLIDGQHLFVRVSEIAVQKQDELLKNFAMMINSELMDATEEQTRDGNGFAISEQLRNMILFQVSRNGQKPVEQILLYGDIDDIVAADIESRLPVPVLMLCNAEASPYVHVMGAAMDTPTLNLLTSFKFKAKQKLTADKSKLVFAVAVLAVSCIFLGGSTWLSWQNNVLSAQCESIRSFVEEPEIIARQAQANVILQKLAEQKAYNKALKDFAVYFDTRFRITSKVYDEMYSLADAFTVKITNISYSTARFSMQCTAPDSFIAAEFAKAMQKHSLVENATFTGYSKAEKDYAFSLDVILKMGGE